MVINRSAARIGRLLGISTAILALTVTTASASPSPDGGGGRHNDAGDEAREFMDGAAQRDAARTAPTGLVKPGAYADAYAQYSHLDPRRPEPGRR